MASSFITEELAINFSIVTFKTIDTQWNLPAFIIIAAGAAKMSMMFFEELNFLHP